MAQTVYKLRVPNDVAELIRKLHPKLKKKIRFSLKMILDNPYTGKVLRDELAGLMSLRVSRFRIIYRKPWKKIIEVVAMGPRDRIYEETYKIIKKEKEEFE